jgi:nitrous oxidase accessory protein
MKIFSVYVIIHLMISHYMILSRDYIIYVNHEIKSVIDSASAGDRIIVKGGKYLWQNVVIEKPLELIGENFPVIDGLRKGDILIVRSNNVIIRGFVFRESASGSMRDYAALKIENSSMCEISGNIFLDNFFSIHVSGSSKIRINGNYIKSNAVSESSSGNGIHLWKCDSNIIVKYSKVKNNLSCYNLRYGLHFMFSNNDEYLDNIFIKNGAGVAVMYTKDVKMFRNFFIDNWGPNSYGLLLKDITDSEIGKNYFENNTVGLYAEGSNRIIINSCLFKSNGWAIKMLGNCENNYTTGSVFLLNSFDVTTNSSSTMSRFEANFWDKYSGFDVNRDGTGDIPYYPVTLYSVMVETIPESIFLLRSLVVDIIDLAEKVIPVLTPGNLFDDKPLMRNPLYSGS